MTKDLQKIRRIEPSQYALNTLIYFVLLAIALQVVSRVAQTNPGFLPYAVFQDPLSLGAGGIVLIILSLLVIAVILGVIHNHLLYQRRAQRGVTVDNISEMEPPVSLQDSGALFPIMGLILGGGVIFLSVWVGFYNNLAFLGVFPGLTLSLMGIRGITRASNRKSERLRGFEG